MKIRYFNMLLLLVLFFLGCSNHNYKNSFFNDKQRGLVNILLKQNDSLLEKKYKLPPNQAFFKQIEELRKSESADKVLNNSFLSNQKMLNDFTDAGFLNRTRFRSYDTVNKKFVVVKRFNYSLNLESSYMKFLEAVSKRNKTINEYSKSIKSSGGISPVSTALLIHKINKQECNDRNIRLIIGIHFLILNQDKNHSTAFKDTYMRIFNNSIIDFRYFKTPTPEQSRKGIVVKPQKRPDTLSPLKLYIQKTHIDVDFDRLNRKLSKMPPGFVYGFKDKTIDYIPNNISRYSNKIYKLIPLDTYNEVAKLFKSKIPFQSDFGGVLQFSKLFLNKKGDKALLFIRDTRHRLNSTESLYLLERKRGKWKIVKEFSISMS